MPSHTVQLFGHYRDYYTDGSVNIELIENATVRDAAEALIESDARFQGIIGICRFAVNDAYPHTIRTESEAGRWHMPS